MRSLFEQASAENRMQFAGPPIMALMRLSKGLLPHTVLRAPPACARTVRAQRTSYACSATQSAATPILLNSIWVQSSCVWRQVLGCSGPHGVRFP